MPRRSAIALVLLIALLGAIVAARLLAAPSLGDGPMFDLPRSDEEWRLRLGRVAAGLVVGAALAVGGVFLQALLRNPLAEPSVLGLTGGAGLAVMAWMYAGYAATGAVVQHHPPILAAAIGSFAALAIVYALGQRRGLIEPVSLILVGVVLSVICAAATVFLRNLLPAQGWALAAQWTMGSLTDDAPLWLLWTAGALTIGAVAAGAWAGPAMDAAALGEDEARSVGLPLGALRLGLFTLAGLLTAGAVVLAGPIGFVGLVCPHAVRLVAGPSHRTLVVGSALAGGALIIGADTLVRIVDLGAGRMPIGVLTALIGGPAFLWLLRRRGVTP